MERAAPIIILTEKHARYKWSTKQDQAFQCLNDSLSVVPLLAYPDPKKHKHCTKMPVKHVLVHIVHTHVMWQMTLYQLHPMRGLFTIFSQITIKTQFKWPYNCKGGVSYPFSLHKLNQYSHGAQFVIKTDRIPPKYLLKSPMQNKKRKRSGSVVECLTRDQRALG